MIAELHIRDLGVIRESRVPLGRGFTAITGETGAGKTMVVSALGLLMGRRADASEVFAGATQARVSGIIEVTDPAIEALIDELGGDVEESELVLTRTVSAEGRSRATAGGAAVPVGALGRIAEHLFAVHGQADQLRLKSAAAQRDTLDRFAGPELAAVLRDYREAHATRERLDARITELAEDRSDRETEIQRLQTELEDIEAVDPQPGEDRELAERIERLSNVEALRQAAMSAGDALASESDDPMQVDASGLIDSAMQHLSRVAGVDHQLDRVAAMLAEVSFQLADAGRDLATYVTDLDAEGPAELARANDRMHALTQLTRQFGVDADAVIDYAEQAALRLAEIDGGEDSVAALEAQHAHWASVEEALAAQLTALRQTAAERLSQEVTAELQQLALPDATCLVTVRELPSLTAAGRDDVHILLSPHPGAEPRPVAKSASGGELSRVMLALEVVLAGVDPVPTFVFDEVDAGIGGAAAIEIGRRLARLARTSQVIVVTHLAQVAAFAENHLQVVKDSTGGFTRSSCQRLEGADRVDEMARLLSGLSTSDSARAHAQELLALSVE